MTKERREKIKAALKILLSKGPGYGSAATIERRFRAHCASGCGDDATVEEMVASWNAGTSVTALREEIAKGERERDGGLAIRNLCLTPREADCLKSLADYAVNHGADTDIVGEDFVKDLNSLVEKIGKMKGAI